MLKYYSRHKGHWWKILPISLGVRIPTLWKSPACWVFLTAPADTVTGPCDPWWSGSVPGWIRHPPSQKHAVGPGHPAPQCTVWPPVQTTNKGLLQNILTLKAVQSFINKTVFKSKLLSYLTLKKAFSKFLKERRKEIKMFSQVWGHVKRRLRQKGAWLYTECKTCQGDTIMAHISK